MHILFSTSNLFFSATGKTSNETTLENRFSLIKIASGIGAMLLLLILVGVCVPTCKRIKQKQVSFYLSINQKGGCILQQKIQYKTKQKPWKQIWKNIEKRIIFLLSFGSNEPRGWHKLSNICLPRGHASVRGKGPAAQPRGRYCGYSCESPWLSCPRMNQSIWTCSPARSKTPRLFFFTRKKYCI